MKFNKYNSLTNHDNSKFLNTVLVEGLADGIFVATEKAHGANFGLHYEGDVVRSSKRSGINGEEENFNGSINITRAHDSKVKALYAYLCLTQPKLGLNFSLAIRGEVIGGMFQGVQAQHAKRVQKEVQYCETNEFLAFDIEINGKAISYNAFESLTTKFGFLVCPEIKRGTLKELLELPNDFDSVIPKIFGNPILEGNTTEGMVLRPLLGERYTSKDVRVIIKSKNSKFKENGGSKQKSAAVYLSDGEHAIGENLTAYFTDQRISNVLSKESAITNWKQFPKLAGLLFQDAVNDFNIDEGCDLKEVLGDNWKSFVRAYKFISDTKLRETFKIELVYV